MKIIGKKIIYIYLYNKLSYVRILIGSHLWSIGSKCGKNISDTFGCASCATFLFLPHFDVICDLLLNRRTAIWNLFVKYIYIYINSAVNISQYVCNGREAIQSLNRLCDVNPRFLLFHFMQIVYFQFLIVNSNYIEHQKLIAELAERSPITIQNSSNPSSRKNLVVRPYKVLLLACAANCITGTILAIT